MKAALLILLVIVGDVASSTSAEGLLPGCTPRACALYREAAIRWRTNARRTREELGYCKETRAALEDEHERALEAFIKDASPPPQKPDEVPLGLVVLLTIVFGLGAFGAGVLLGTQIK